jgi:hypothetical protein
MPARQDHLLGETAESLQPNPRDVHCASAPGGIAEGTTGR